MEIPDGDDLLEGKDLYRKKVLKEAASRFVNINKQPDNQEWRRFPNKVNDILVCQALCRYMKAEFKLPMKDVSGGAGNFTFLEEMLYLSGLNYKEAALPEGWWKHNNGVMLGMLKDKTPVALLPDKISGYLMYDPVRNVTIKINARTASDICNKVTMIFRMLPSKSIGFKDVMKFIAGERISKELTVILLFAFIAGIIQIIPPIVSAQIFDVIIPEKQSIILFQVVFILTAFALADIGCSIIINLGISRVNTRIGFSVQMAVWDRLLSLKLSFFNQFTTGGLIQKIKGIELMKELMSVERFKDLISGMFILLHIIILFWYFAEITPYVLLMFLCLFILYGMISMKKYELHKTYIENENKAAAFHHQSLQGVSRIKISCAEEQAYNRWSFFEAKKYNVKHKIHMLDHAFGAFYMFFQFFSAAAVYFLISREETIAMGAFIAYSSTFLLLQKSMGRLIAALDIFPEMIAVGRDIKPILEAEPEYDRLKTIPNHMSGTLEVNHAAFRYGRYGRTIFSDISFQVKEGESIGIVGLSGSGKSTLLKVLMGFYAPLSGKIYYGGHDLETIDLRYLRKCFGVVLQDGRLTVGDIYSNVIDNNDSIGYEEVMEALKKAGLDTMVENLPDGLHTRLEHHPMSAGEKQRLLIARAIVKKCKFIFLDEATSSLDNLSQRRIMKNLRDISATKVIVAQRLETVKYCDTIIVLEHGRIARQGNYETIVKNQIWASGETGDISS